MIKDGAERIPTRIASRRLRLLLRSAVRRPRLSPSGLRSSVPGLLLLWLMFALAVHSLSQKSPTFDEQGFLVRGLAYVRGENRHMRVGHPLGLNAFNALLLAGDESVALPVEDPSWAETSFHRPAELFLWEIGNDVEKVMFLARLPTVWLGLLMAAICSRWAGKLTGKKPAALIALALVALDPNILAHTRLTTTDLGLAAGATLAGYTLWRFLHRPGWTSALIAGVGFGLLQNTKFTALLFVPIFGLVILYSFFRRWRETGRFPGKMTAQLILVYPLAAFITLWAGYGFQIGTLPADLPTFSQLAGHTVPLAHHLEQLLDIGGRVQQTTASFLLGRYSDSGWWLYFPVAFLIKTPRPTLILFVWAIVRLFRGKWPAGKTDLAALFFPAIGFFLFAMTTDINIGYRHILPVLPFLYVFIGASFPDRLPISFPEIPSASLRRFRETGRALVRPVLLLWLLLVTLWISPHFLAYFNVLAGGTENGWRWLVDSNLDWGQDLRGLAEWQQETGNSPLWLSYFGEARPDYYGINYIGLDSYPPRLMNPAANPFLPSNPAPGLYAISATNLQGVLFQNHDQFAWFRDQEPIAKIGYSIFLYEVPAKGEPAGLALGGVQLNEIAPVDVARFNTNDITPRWFNPAESLLVPAGSRNGFAIAKRPFAFQELLAEIAAPLSANETYTFYQQNAGANPATAPSLAAWSSVEKSFAFDDGEIILHKVQVEQGDEEIVVRTAWEQLGAARPVKIFIHYQDYQGQIITQWDGIGVIPESWQVGDWLVQESRLPLPDGIPAGDANLVIGLYDPQTLDRWQTPDISSSNSLDQDHSS